MSPFSPPDPAGSDYTHLENLACGYWHSEVFFTSLNLDLFSKLGSGTNDLQTFAAEHDFANEGLERLCSGLKQLGLLEHEDGFWFSSQMSRTYLDTASPDCLRDFFLYRQYMQAGWQNLGAKIGTIPPPAITPESPYAERNLYYVKALDLLARQKGIELVEIVNKAVSWQGNILDIGGGAGALTRAFLRGRPKQRGVIVDLAEVHDSARAIYPEPGDWQNIDFHAGDFTTPVALDNQHFGLIIMANCLHAYDQNTAEELLHKACGLLSEDGVLVIHDYFPDRKTGASAKGVLYDLHMLANTYNGTCHGTTTLRTWLRDNGLPHVEVMDLGSDSSLIIASRSQSVSTTANWQQLARKHGFRTGVVMDPQDVITAPWVAMKCQFGCDKFGRGLQCPPFSMESTETRELLDSYSQCLLVESTPPGNRFHEQLLGLERTVFLQGYHKAFVLGAGPCTLCPSCDTAAPCSQPAKARPAMEACGIDVYETAQKAGLPLSPRTDQRQYVKYIGLLLIK